MRMWNVSPKIMCRKHLLGEHVEMHMAIGALKNKISLNGYIDSGLIEVHNIVKRHDKLADEMAYRGYNHKSPLVYDGLYVAGKVDINKSYSDLFSRCAECKKNRG